MRLKADAAAAVTLFFPLLAHVQVLAAIDKLLAENGTDKRRLLMVSVFLSDISSHFERFNAVYDTWLSDCKGHAPPRATVRACVRVCADTSRGARGGHGCPAMDHRWPPAGSLYKQFSVSSVRRFSCLC